MNVTLKDLTIEEKCKLLVGMDWWQLNHLNEKLPKVCVSDGPHGLRMGSGAGDADIKDTAMPNLSALASSWNTELAYMDGQTIADDCVQYGADILLAPGVNIKRTPLCGRNFEYPSEDPFLSGEIAKAFINGVQDKGIGTSLKHFAANNREFARLSRSSEIDERTLREIYLPAFEKALEAKPWTVMCSYNLLNGIYASENYWLLKEILRDTFGFDGLIMSDWSAVRSAYRAVKATLDLRMPGDKEDMYKELLDAYEKGLVSEEEIDFCVQNVLNLMEKAQKAQKKVEWTKTERHERAVEIAKESIVLLKNEDNILPLKSGNVTVIGSFAANPPLGGGGSAYVNTDFKQTLLSELIDKKTQANVTLGFCDRPQGWVKLACRQAYENDIAVVCVGEGSEIEAESFDRTNIKLAPWEENMILEVANVNPNTVVLVYAGSAIDMSAWIDKVKGVVWVGYLGEGCNEALSDVLAGIVSPSGKLSETLPICIEDTPAGNEIGNLDVDLYSEGLLIGYRYYDTKKKDVLFPFGHGLSYATFKYDNLNIEKTGDTDFTVSYDITNESDIDAKEVSEIYIKDVFSSVFRPEKELKGFSKDLIPAHSTKRVSIKLNRRSFAFYSVPLHDWYVENGDFEVLVGASSRDIRLVGKLKIELDDVTQNSN